VSNQTAYALLMALFLLSGVGQVVIIWQDYTDPAQNCLAKFESMGVIHYDSSTGECWFTMEDSP